MTKQEAIADVVKHWGRMINFALTRDKNEKVSAIKMRDAIHQSWGGNYCELCKKYDDIGGCEECPLAIKYIRCMNNDSQWRKVDRSKTWGEWIVEAQVMLEMLKSLEEE